MAKHICYHCGSTTGSFIEHEGKDFCCRGCATVYDILKTNQLYTYYELEVNPGNRSSESTVNNRYEYLDQDEIKRSVLDFYDGEIAKVRLYIPSIHCSSCIWLLENLHRINKGVLQSSVNFTKKEVSISFYEREISLSNLMRLLESIHYKPILQKNRESKKSKKNTSLVIKLGISGFAFGNVMLLSFPDYVSSTFAIDGQFTRYFGWISLFLSLPVMLYSASDYFQSALKNLRKQIISIDLPIAIGILAIFFRSTAELIIQSGTGYFDSLTGLVFFLLIGKWYQDKTYKALSFESDYTSYFPLGITRIIKNKEEIIPIGRISIGDIILVHNQEIIPADSILQSERATIDYSFITGESLPVEKTKGEKIFAGGRQLGKTIRLTVEKDVETSYLAQLWKERTKPQPEGTIISQTLDSVSRYFTVAILGISAIAGLFWYFIEPSVALIAFTSVLIVACPCALALSAPFTFGHAQSILGKNHFFLKHSSIIEKLSGIDTVVFDKTGTLTDANQFEVSIDSNLLASGELINIKALVKNSFHPLSRAIYQSIEGDESDIDTFEEIPGMGVKGTIKNKEYWLGSATFIHQQSPVLKDNTSEVFASVDNTVLGRFQIRNIYRKNWEDLIGKLSRQCDFHLLSGDNDHEKNKIAKVTGSADKLYFNQSPRDKLQYIRNLKQAGRSVLMVGDGLNDAGALHESDVGISVANDIYQFLPACDGIIKADVLGELSRFLVFTARAKKVVWVSIIFSFLYNIVGIYFAASGQLSPLIAAILMPLSSVTVVVLTTVLTTVIGKRAGL